MVFKTSEFIIQTAIRNLKISKVCEKPGMNKASTILR